MRITRFVILFAIICAGAWLARPVQGSPPVCDTVSDMPWAECSALVDLYTSTNGTSWTNQSGWLTDTQACTWFGVTCTSGAVSELRLASNNLVGTIPSSLANLSNLTWLEVQSNQLTGTIPPGLGGLSALTELSLYFNTLNGTIPPELGALGSLNALRLGHNDLTGTIPPELGNLSNLTILGIDDNFLEGSLPPELGNLNKLELFNADLNNLTGSIPSTFGNFPQIWRLWLENNQLSGPLPTELSNLSKLRSFSIQNNQFSGPIPSSYSNLTAWNNVNLAYNKLYASGATLVNFLNSKDPDWAQTQTVAPSNVQATALSGNSVKVTWTPILYTGDGGYYEVSYGATPGGPYTVHGVTGDKSATEYTVTGLATASTYFFVVRSYTPAHGSQNSPLISDYSAEASATTGAFACADVSEIPATECNALVALFTATTGANWTKKNDWLVTSTPCSWYGITCSGGHVSKIELTTNNLKGTLPASIGDFPSLTALLLSTNQIAGAIPPEIGNLTNLTRLLLSSNQFSGEIPSTIGNLVNLQQFFLNYDQLTGPIPSQIGNLSKLIRFGAIGNQLSGSIPAQFGNLTNMTELYLNENLFSGPIPSELGNLAKLTTLLLNHNQLNGDVPTTLANLTLLTQLNVGYNKVTASDQTLVNFLNNTDPDWAQTQTVPPTNLQAAAQSSFAIKLTWTPIAYTADGGYYEVRSATSAGGPYTVAGVTPDKSTATFTVNGLLAAKKYYFVVRTFTPAQGNQKSDLWSAYSLEVSATTQQETTLIPPTITSSPTTKGLRGQPYAYSVVASGSAPLSFVLVTGPAGMNVDPATGLVSWTPTATGPFAVTVRVSNDVGSKEQSFTINVEELPKITTDAVTSGLVGELYAYDVDASGLPAPTFALITKPTGMTINGSGLINWTPQANGLYSVSVTASNVHGVDTQDFAILVTTVTQTEAPVFLSQPNTMAALGQPYLYDADASGIPNPAYSLITAPPGMEINSTTGAITWTPRDAGSFAVTVQAINSVDAATQSFTIIVPAPPAGDPYEDDDDCANATLILTTGGRQQHTFHDPGDRDWLRFDAQAFKTYVIEVRNIGPKADAVIQLHDTCDRALSTLENNAFGSSVRLEWDSTKTGSYYVDVSQFDGVSAGADTAYEISVQADNTPPAAPRSPRCTRLNEQTGAVQWQKSPERDVRGYRIAFTGIGNAGNEDVSGAATTYYELGGLLPNQAYELRVSAVDFSGNEGPQSGKFICPATTPPDSTPPTMSLTQPAASNFYSTTAYSLTFTGMATDDSGLARALVKNVTKNQEGADNSLSGNRATFRVADIGLAVGDNSVQVAVYDDAGNAQQRNVVVRRLGAVPGAVLIVAGHNDTFGLQANINFAANRAYRIFRSAGYGDDNIQYLAPTDQDADGDGVFDTDGVSSPAAVQQAITEWAASRVGADKPFYLYMVDHGFAEKFCALGCGASGAITPENLDDWLKSLESATGANQITVVIEACESGSFIDRANPGGVKNSLSRAGRVIITSTGAENNAYASAQGAYFSDAFFSCMADSTNLRVCFEQARDAVAATGVDQTPWMDDNGDAVFNSGDGTVANNRVLTRFFSSVRPVITDISVNRSGANGTLTAIVEDGAEQTDLVWAAVFPPSFAEPDDVTINLAVPTVRLEPLSNQPGQYTFNYVNGFTEAGDYRIIFYAQDRLGINANPRLEGEQFIVHLPVVSK